jgi:thymidylate kinase
MFGTISIKVVALVIDVDTLKRRVANREDSFGKLPEELERILRWHNNYEDSYRQFGALIVDATRPAEEVVDLILAKLQLIASRPMGRDRWRGPPSPAQRHHRAGGWPVSPSP